MLINKQKNPTIPPVQYSIKYKVKVPLSCPSPGPACRLGWLGETRLTGDGGPSLRPPAEAWNSQSTQSPLTHLARSPSPLESRAVPLPSVWALWWEGLSPPSGEEHKHPPSGGRK